MALMIETILIVLGLVLIGASIVMIVMVIPKLGQVREDWLRAQRKKQAIADAERAADELAIAFMELSAAVNRIGAAFVSAFAGVLSLGASNAAPLDHEKGGQ